MKHLISILTAAAVLTPAAQAQKESVKIEGPAASKKLESKNAGHKKPKAPSKSIDIDAAGKRVDARLKKDAKTLKNFFGIDTKKEQEASDTSESKGSQKE